MAEEAITLEFLARLCQQTLQEARALRKEVADIRTLTLHAIEYSRRIERRVSEQRDDLELMIKAELGGAFAHMQTQMENHQQQEMDRLVARIRALELART